MNNRVFLGVIALLGVTRPVFAQAITPTPLPAEGTIDDDDDDDDEESADVACARASAVR